MSDDAKRERDARYDARRLAQQPWRKWYKLKRWLELRDAQLSKQPLCERCERKFRLVRATVAHHKVPHRGDAVLFFDPENLASSCKPCHDGHEQSVEVRGYDRTLGADGWPVDPNHPANRKPSSTAR